MPIFGSTCHGSGRVKSRATAKRALSGQEVLKELSLRGITIRTGNLKDLAEEAPDAYKNITSVLNVVHKAGISRIVARTKPIGVVKG